MQSPPSKRFIAKVFDLHELWIPRTSIKVASYLYSSDWTTQLRHGAGRWERYLHDARIGVTPPNVKVVR